MSLRKYTLLLMVATLLLPNIVRAQAPAAPAVPAPPMTLWRFLGIPQGANKVHAQLFNRRGNFPGLEKKPPLKALADPSNLQSPIKAIEMAAKVKQDMDLAPQKIKAVKFLAKHACGCHNDKRGGEIVDALVAMMDDCTDDVRMATVKAIAKSTRGECCGDCGAQCCCDEKIVKKLAVLAYEKDDNGCWVEPNEKIRNAAADAMQACCPGRGTGEIVPERAPERPDPPSRAPEGNNNNNAPTSSGNITYGRNPQRHQRRPLSSFINTSLRRNSSTQAATPSRQVTQERAATPRPVAQPRQQPTLVSAAKKRSGTTLFVDRKRNMAQVRLAKPTKLQVGGMLKVYEPQAYGYRLLGHMEIVQTDGVQTANVRPVGKFHLSLISAGTVVIPAE